MSVAQIEQESLSLRSCLGRFATGVAVVLADAEDGQGPHAMTASSFLSVSLDPPIALISVRAGARMHDQLSRSDRFSVNVLDAAQEDVAMQFAGRPGPNPIAVAEWCGTPVVRPALATFLMRSTAIVPAGDHYLHLGEIEHFGSRRGAPLLHFGGTFRRLDEDQPSMPSGLHWWAGDCPW